MKQSLGYPFSKKVHVFVCEVHMRRVILVRTINKNKSKLWVVAILATDEIFGQFC